MKLLLLIIGIIVLGFMVMKDGLLVDLKLIF